MTPLPPVPQTVTPTRPAQGGTNPGRQEGGFADVLASVEREAQAGSRSHDRVPAERSDPGPDKTTEVSGGAAPGDTVAPGTAPEVDEPPAGTVDTPAVAAPVVIAATQLPVVLDPALMGTAPVTGEGEAAVDPIDPEAVLAVGAPVVNEVQPDTVTEVEGVEAPTTTEAPTTAEAPPTAEAPTAAEAAAPTVPTGPATPAGVAQPQPGATPEHDGTTDAGQPVAPVEETAAPAVEAAADDAPAVTAAAPMPADGDAAAEAGDATAQPSTEAGDAVTTHQTERTVPTRNGGGAEADAATATDLPRSVSSTGPSRSDGAQDQAPTVTFSPGAPATSPSTPVGPARPLTGMPAFATAQAMATPASQVASAVAALHRGADGVHEVSLEMHPTELGRVNVEVEVRAGVVNLRLSAEHDATRSLLNARLDDLRAALEQGGLQSGSMELSQHAFGRDGRDGDSGSRATSTGLPGGPASTATTVISAPRQHHTATSVDLLV